MSFDASLPRFAGSCAALVTPFKNGAVDADSFCKLVDFQIDNGTAGLVPVGTTGESPTLSHEEHDLVVELCIKQAAGRVPVIAGAGSNSTAEAVRLAEHAETAGADAVLHAPRHSEHGRREANAASRRAGAAFLAAEPGVGDVCRIGATGAPQPDVVVGFAVNHAGVRHGDCRVGRARLRTECR